MLTLTGAVAGLIWARGLASGSMILFGANALWDVSPKRWLRNKWWLLGLGWIALYALSFFWTSNTFEWGQHLQVKLPFLLLPLAFGFLPPFTRTQRLIFLWALVLMVCTGALYSLSFLAHSSSELIESYKYAHVLPTPMYNDHIMFSTTVAITVALLCYYLPSMTTGWLKATVVFFMFFLALYVHILAAKTGIIALYLLLAGLLIRQFFIAPKRALLLLITVSCCVSMVYVWVPTFRERIGYSLVTWRSYQRGERSGVYSDAGRVISYDLALKFIEQHPVIGVGCGDVLDEMKTGYMQFYPEVPEAQMLWPHNQFLTTAMAAGIPAALLLMLWIAWPLKDVRSNREGRYFIVIWIMLLVPLMVDLILEVQAGVGVYLIFLLWQRKSMIDAYASDEGHKIHDPALRLNAKT